MSFVGGAVGLTGVCQGYAAIVCPTVLLRINSTIVATSVVTIVAAVISILGILMVGCLLILDGIDGGGGNGEFLLELCNGGGESCDLSVIGNGSFG